MQIFTKEARPPCLRSLPWVMATLFLLFSLHAAAQTTVTGKVQDPEGVTLPGVSVKLRGTATGAVTDADGKFTLRLPEARGVLIFSYIGFDAREEAINGRSQVNVILERSNNALNEVLVVGYGTVNRKDLTGSVGRANVEDMQKAPVRSFEEALAGRVAGVQVTSQDGKPGSPINIIIRGVSSVTQDNSPLYVIDGFPMQNPNNNVIDPNDIESIDVLKDASATAIYGARGSNGVIIITTKRGKAGVPVVSYSGSYGVAENLKRMELLSPYEFVKLQGEMSGANTPYLQEGRTLEDYRNVKGVDWQDKLFRKAPMQSHSLSLGGGSDRTRYTISGSYLNQDGIIIVSGFKRYQGKITLDQNINDKMKAGANMTYTNTNISGMNPTATGPTSLFYNAFAYRPVEVAGLDRDFEETLQDPANPLADLRVNPFLSAQNEVRNSIANNFIGNLYLEYNILKNLKLRVTGGLNSNAVRGETFDGSQTNKGNPNRATGVSGQVVNTQVSQLLNENTLRYDKIINKNHRFDILGGFTVQQTNINAYGFYAERLPNEILGLSGLEQGTLTTGTAVTSSSALVSGLAIGNYTFKDRYLFKASIRADGSSKFRADNQWSYFPAGAFAWRFSDEPFMKKHKFLSEGKLRLSWGVNGNNRVSDYATYANLAFTNGMQYPFNNTLGDIGAAVVSLSNPELKWETTASSNVGLDIGLFNSAVTVTVDYYSKVTSNLLLSATLPPVTGYGSAIKNIGKIANNGLEFTLNTVNISRPDFTWSTNFNIFFNRNKLLALSSNEETLTSQTNWEFTHSGVPSYIAKLNEPLGNIYGWISEGLYQYEDFDKMPNGSYVLKGNEAAISGARATTRPGDSKFRDLNKDGILDLNDRIIIGRGYPIHQGGFSNNFQYRQFDLNIFFQWSYGSDIINANKIWFRDGYALFRGGNNNMFAEFANRWTPDNTNTTIPRYSAGQQTAAYSTRVVEDGSFLRLKTINLGYKLPKHLLERAKIRSARVFVSAYNLFTWTKYSGYDPEVSSYYSALTPGVDWSSYPRPLTVAVGLNLQL